MLKGRTVIELQDINTGEVRKIESHNFMTNSFQKMLTPVFALNHPDLYDLFGNTTDHYSKLKKLFGGLYLYDAALPEDPDTVYAPAGSTLVGVGGNAAYTGTDTLRGSFNTSMSGPYTDEDTGVQGGYKFVWDFTAEQGNGTIGSACLTTDYGGLVTQGSPTVDTSVWTHVTADPWQTLNSYNHYFSPDIDTTGASSSYVSPYYHHPYAMLKIDPVNNYYITFGDAGELNYSGPVYASSSESFAESLFTKKYITLRKSRIPCNNVSAFEVFSHSAYDETTRPAAEALSTISVDQVVMPEELQSAIDTALALGSSKRFVPMFYTTPKYLYMILVINEGLTENYGVAVGENMHIWRIDYSDYSSEYYVVNNTTEEVLGNLYYCFKGSDTYYPKVYAPSVVNDKYLVVKGYTTRKVYLMSLGGTEVRTVKLESDPTQDYVSIAAEMHRGTPYGEKLLYESALVSSYWNYTGRTDSIAKYVIIDPVKGTAQFAYTKYAAWSYYTNWGTGMFMLDDNCPLMYILYPSSNYATTLNTHLSVDPTALMTINNLDAPVTKTDQQTMRITYIVTPE